jgi:hypothetical protein
LATGGRLRYVQPWGQIVGFFSKHRHGHDAPSAGSAPGPLLTPPPDWEPVTGTPFDGHLETRVAEINRVRHGAGRGMIDQQALRVGPTEFRDAHRSTIDGRTITVANAWTNIDAQVRFAEEHWRAASVVAVELPTVISLVGIRPRALPTADRYLAVVPSGDAAFDERYVVTGTPDSAELLTADVRARVAARDDWYICFERYLMGCVGAGVLRTADDVTTLSEQALAIVTALPASAVPTAVDHSADDIVARAMRLTTMEEGMQFLQALTPEERATLARSDSPLASLADAHTPQEAMQRFRGLDQAAKMQLMAQFMRVKDAGR